MKKGKMKKVKIKFEARPSGFEVVPVPAAPFRGTQETELDRLKARLLCELLKSTADAELYSPLRRAANDAAAVAWTTCFPLLVFPTLLEEKAREARQHHNRQRTVLARSRRLMGAAA
jgi:hypothetical protein